MVVLLIQEGSVLVSQSKNESLRQRRNERRLLSKDTEKALRSERVLTGLPLKIFFGWPFIQNLTRELRPWHFLCFLSEWHMAFWGDLVSLCDYFVAVKGRYSLTFGARWPDLLLYLPFLALSLFLLHLGVLGIYGSLTLGPSPYLFLPSPICP